MDGGRMRGDRYWLINVNGRGCGGAGTSIRVGVPGLLAIEAADVCLGLAAKGSYLHI